MWNKILAGVCVVGIVLFISIVYIDMDELEGPERGEIDRWAATEYTITCIEEWNSGHGIRTHSTHSQAPYCELSDADGVRYPLEYTINYDCNGEDNLVFTLNENSWGRVFPGCEN